MGPPRVCGGMSALEAWQIYHPIVKVGFLVYASPIDKGSPRNAARSNLNPPQVNTCPRKL
jgi:hypothetical protein